jgi:hypothetical protein
VGDRVSGWDSVDWDGSVGSVGVSATGREEVALYMMAMRS